MVFYGDTGTVGISSAGLTGPLDPTRFADAKEFAVVYRNSLSGKEAAIDSINGSLVPTLWPEFTPIPEPSSMILVVPIVIAGLLKMRSGKLLARRGQATCRIITRITDLILLAVGGQRATDDFTAKRCAGDVSVSRE